MTLSYQNDCIATLPCIMSHFINLFKGNQLVCTLATSCFFMTQHDLRFRLMSKKKKKLQKTKRNKRNRGKKVCLNQEILNRAYDSLPLGLKKTFPKLPEPMGEVVHVSESIAKKVRTACTRYTEQKKSKTAAKRHCLECINHINDVLRTNAETARK